MTRPYIEWDLEKYPQLWRAYLKNLNISEAELDELDSETVKSFVEEGPVKDIEDNKLRSAMSDGKLQSFDTRDHTIIKYHSKFHDKLKEKLGTKEESWKLYDYTSKTYKESNRQVTRYPAGTIIDGTNVGGRIRSWKIL